MTSLIINIRHAGQFKHDWVKLADYVFFSVPHVCDTIVRAIYKRICGCLQFYKHSYSILLLLSTDFYNLAPRGIKKSDTI
jgi:hypothetical protein